jgi:hypothetical protein
MLVDGKVLVMAGKDELFVDDIVAFGQKLKIFAATTDDWRTKPRVRRATLVLLTWKCLSGDRERHDMRS